MAKNRPENVFLGKNCFDFGSMHIKVYLEDFVQLLILCKQNSTKSALKQVFLLIFRVKITVSEQKTKMSGTSRRIKYQKIKKYHLAVFEKFEKEHKKQVFLHLYRCKKQKIKKTGPSQGIH